LLNLVTDNRCPPRPCAGFPKGHDVTEDVRCAIQRRILVARTLYAIGAALCLVNTYASIGFIVLVQLNFAIAPRILRLNRF
jgi:hypothetical protein